MLVRLSGVSFIFSFGFSEELHMLSFVCVSVDVCLSAYCVCVFMCV